jgi:membrane protease YdiL (CAAX protease family)
VQAVGCWKTIAASGVLFGLLHVVYGNPSPENLVGGFFLAWAYLKSESILIPFILHAGGNLIVWLGQIAGWYFLEH